MPINNLGKVHGTKSWGLILRSAQPSIEDFETLKELIGPYTSYRLSADDEGGVSYKDEQETLHSIGCELFVDTRLGTGLNPDVEDLKNIAKAVDSLYVAGHTILIHCIHGRERTGAVSAAWRILYGGATVDEALVDLETYGVSGLIAIVDHEIIETIKKLGGE